MLDKTVFTKTDSGGLSAPRRQWKFWVTYSGPGAGALKGRRHTFSAGVEVTFSLGTQSATAQIHSQADPSWGSLCCKNRVT